MALMLSSNIKWCKTRKVLSHYLFIAFNIFWNQVHYVMNRFDVIPESQPMKWSVFYLRSNIVPSGVLCNVSNILLFKRWNQQLYDLLSVTLISLFHWVELVFVTFDAQNVEWCSEHGILGSDDETEDVKAFVAGSFYDEFTERIVSIGSR